MVRKMINWCDKTFKRALDEEDDRKGNALAFASGAVEGYMEAAVVMYPLAVFLAWYWAIQANKEH